MTSFVEFHWRQSYIKKKYFHLKWKSILLIDQLNSIREKLFPFAIQISYVGKVNNNEVGLI